MIQLYNIFLEKIILPFGDFVYGSSFIKNIKEWRKICKLNEKEIQQLTLKNLKKMLEHSCNVRFYKKYNIEYSEDPVYWLKKFPIITKNDLEKYQDEFINSSFEKKDLIKCKSSGSSGIQTTTYQTKKEQSANRAIQILWWEWSGYFLGKRIVQTGINTNRTFIKIIKDFLLRTKYISAFAHSESQVVSLLKKISGKSNIHFGGYASSLNIFAEIAKNNKIKGVCFDAAISWGDKLFNHYINNIQKQFKCNVFDTYGCSEGFLVGAKKDLDYFYIMSPHIYLEVVDDDGNTVKAGDRGNILITRLDNFSMPIIRYKIGDIGSLLPEEDYPTEREMYFPLLKELIGRDTDIIKTKSNNYMVVHSFTGIFEHIDEIKQFKVKQTNLQSITIEYIPRNEFNKKILEKIESQIILNLKEDINVIWEKVDKISVSSSGKPILVESKITK